MSSKPLISFDTIADPFLQLRNTGFQKHLSFLGGLVLGVLAQVSHIRGNLQGFWDVHFKLFFGSQKVFVQFVKYRKSHGFFSCR